MSTDHEMSEDIFGLSLRFGDSDIESRGPQDWSKDARNNGGQNDKRVRQHH